MDWQNQNNKSQQGANYRSHDTTLDALISTMQRVQVLSDSNEDLRSKISQQNKQIGTYSDLLKKSDSTMKDHEDRLKEMDEKYKVMESDLKNTRDKTLEPLAVFVGLFTFVSVGFNIFANVSDTSLWISLLLIIAGMMIIFASLVIHAGSLATKENDRRFWTGSLVCAGVIILLVGTGIHISTNRSLPSKDTTSANAEESSTRDKSSNVVEQLDKRPQE